MKRLHYRFLPASGEHIDDRLSERATTSTLGPARK
jgi:hypothetical protein